MHVFFYLTLQLHIACKSKRTGGGEVGVLYQIYIRVANQTSRHCCIPRRPIDRVNYAAAASTCHRDEDVIASLLSAAFSIEWPTQSTESLSAGKEECFYNKVPAWIIQDTRADHESQHWLRHKEVAMISDEDYVTWYPGRIN
ncbi:hypothetical protein CDAR_108351 [Caerostris darwini]|uniref:Uncharacterized protein n=1 Tax=Caerostris darwini TaxID=1538125 RepID=A0AAV4PRR5_9ARAC|nr:hypothetical protein CDAR_108351 [Caerostris darwini]